MTPNVVSGSGVVANNHEAIIEKSDGTVVVLKLPDGISSFGNSFASACWPTNSLTLAN
jgi:hypothetical protein